MDYETIKNVIENYITENNLKYLRKSHLADFAIKNNYEIEDINDLFNYDGNITQFKERINGSNYRRYITKTGLTNRDIETITGLHYCNACGVFSTDVLTASDGKQFCSTECARYNNYYICTECGKLEKVAYDDGATYLCQNCLNENAAKYDLIQCDNCKKYFKKSTLYQAGGKNYCHLCVNSLASLPSWHHGSKRFTPRHNNREKRIYFGFENEMETKGNTPRAVVMLGLENVLKENGLAGFFRYESDGSLDETRGLEAIGEPATLAYYYENLEKFLKVYDFIGAAKCSGELTRHAGLHIHISRNAFEKSNALALFAYIIHVLQYDFLKFSKRPLNNLEYTEFDSFSNSDGVYTLEDFIERYKNDSYNSSHYAVVNREHDKTIEFRLFRGTTDFKRILANIELVNNLVYYVNNHTEQQCKNVTFKEICLFKKTKFLKRFYYETFEPNTKLKEEGAA